MRMKKAFVAAVAVLLMTGFGFAATIVYDLNGNPADGPDMINVPVSTNVPVDIWIFGPPDGAISFGTIMCNPDHSLVYVSCLYSLPTGWTGIAPQAPGADNCITVQGVTFTGTPVAMLPYKFATVTWHAAVDQSIDTLISGATSAVMSPSFSSFSFENNEQVLATIQIGTIVGTEETNWGAVKSLFR
jgi:hypothetical protein